MVLEHLQNCENCRAVYLEQLRLYYTLEHEKVLIPQSDINAGFKKNIITHIDKNNLTKFQFQKKWVWYAAAALLICGIFIGRFLLSPTDQSYNPIVSEAQSIAKLIENEDWEQVQSILADQEQYTKYADETLDVITLIEKLDKLKSYRQIVPKIKITSMRTQDREPLNYGSALIEISVVDFIDLLEQIKQRKSEITLEEMSEILVEL